MIVPQTPLQDSQRHVEQERTRCVAQGFVSLLHTKPSNSPNRSSRARLYASYKTHRTSAEPFEMADRRVSESQTARSDGSPGQSRRSSSNVSSIRSGQESGSPVQPIGRVALWQTAKDIRVIELGKTQGTWSITVQPSEHAGSITVPLGREPECNPHLQHYFTLQYGQWEINAKLLHKLKRRATLDCFWRLNQDGKLEIRNLKWPLSHQSTQVVMWLESMTGSTKDSFDIADLVNQRSASKIRRKENKQKNKKKRQHRH